MRLYISADIEGVHGVATKEQTMPQGFEYESARKWMTNEVLTVVEAASSLGVEECVVSDSHGNGLNILVDELPKNVRLVRSWPRPLGMMQGVELDGIAGAVLLGYHTGASDSDGILGHTLYGALVAELRLNGAVASETYLSAAIAGHFNVPVIMATGDDHYVSHANSVLGDIETATTKHSYGWHSTCTISPMLAMERISHASKRALSRLGEMTPFVIDAPVVVEIDFKHRTSPELLSYFAFVERTGPWTIRYKAADVVDASKFLTAALVTAGAAVPA